LALFSRLLAPPQSDWPVQTLQPGFVYLDGNFDHAKRTAPIAALKEFLASGDAPIAFTQGSTAVHNPGDFYKISMEAAKRLGCRAVLVGANTSDLPERSSDSLALSYIPYQELFPNAAVTVHQGGSGTTGQAMQAGRPTLIVPYGWDQPDNASRVERLGSGLHLPRSRYSVDTAVAALERLLGQPRFAQRALEVDHELQKEDGLNGACDAIESVLARS